MSQAKGFNMKKTIAIIAATLGIAGIATTSSLAHKGATGIVMERMMAMGDMAKGMKKLAAMVTGKAPYDVEKTRAIAKQIGAHAVSIPEQFPEGSIKGPSEATPNIWTEWDTFAKHAKDLETYAVDLHRAANSGKRASLAMFAKMGKTCSGCHQDFRKKKE